MQTHADSRTGLVGGKRAPAVSRLLTHRYLPLAVAILAAALTLPSLRVGWIIDDYYLRWTILGSESYHEILKPPWDIFNFFDGDPARTGRMMDIGLIPWWTYPKIKGAFWRPLAALSHLLDFRVWPESPAWMHLHSVLWYAALVAAVALLYRRLLGPVAAAGLAALLYAVDDAHGIAVGLLANRNGMLSAFFGVLAIVAHDRWRRAGWRAGAVVGPALLAASLLSAEIGISTCAYLAAHAIALDSASWRRRCAAMLPYAAVVLVWRVLYSLGGYGVYAGELYDDPLAGPLRFALMVVRRAPLYLLAQWAQPPTELALFLPPAGARIIWLGGLACAAVLAVAMAPLLRRSRTARFWALGMIMALIGVCASAPMNRLLFFVGIGAMGLLAEFLTRLVAGRTRPSQRRARRAAAASLGVVFVLVHLLVAPVALALFAAFPLGPGWVLRRLHTLPNLDRSIQQQDLVIVSHPLPLHAAHLLANWAASGRPVPRHTRTLATANSALDIRRPDSNTLVIRARSGFITTLVDRIMRGREHPFLRGQRVELTGMTVTVTELTDDGRPAEAVFRFAAALEDPSLRWVQWKDRAFRPFRPPAVGQSLHLPAEGFLRGRRGRPTAGGRPDGGD